LDTSRVLDKGVMVLVAEVEVFLIDIKGLLDILSTV
jgi:hypothetical protein